MQIESLGSGTRRGPPQVGGLHLRMVSSHGSQNLAGSLPNALGTAESVLLPLALLGIWTAAALGPATRERLPPYSPPSVAAVVAFATVLSPPVMFWLLPLRPPLRGRRGAVASGLLRLALLLTPLWGPILYH